MLLTFETKTRSEYLLLIQITMMTAILVFFGLSSCATLVLITAVMAGARRTAPIDVESEPVILTSSTESKATFVPSYGLQS